MAKEIINLYGAEIVGTLLVTVFGILGMMARMLAAKYLDTPAKQTLAKLAVQFTEQTVRELHGEEKLNAALGALSELLAQRHIRATEAEMRILIEAAVAEFNGVFRGNAKKSGIHPDA